MPLYPNSIGDRFVLQFKDYEPTFQFYGLPDYVAALEHSAVDYEIGKWNHITDRPDNIRYGLQRKNKTG